MLRSQFLRAAAGVAAAPLVPLVPLAVRAGTLTTQRELFAALPAARPRQWTRIILGSGATYQKQIGVGVEHSATGDLLYYETQIGMPGGSCNPASMRKAYLRAHRFGSLFDEYPLLTNIGRTENLIYRYGDADGSVGANVRDRTLRLLDEAYLYDSRDLRVLSATHARIHVASAEHDTVHVVAQFAAPRSSRDRLERIELWHAPELPFGVAKVRATARDMEPFELHVYAHGADFASMLSLSLARVRGITQGGQYGQLPDS